VASHVLLRKAVPVLCGANFIMEKYYEQHWQVGRTYRIPFALIGVAARGADRERCRLQDFFSILCKLPAGNYRVSQPEMGDEILQIQNLDLSRSVFVDFTPTESVQPHRNSAVSFEKYGDTDYMDRVWIGGETYGMKTDPTRVEAAAAAAVNAEQHTANGQ
jgi:hypothetical protein